MREILFRGKRVDNGEWVEGSLVCFPNDYEIGTIVCFEEEDEAGFVFGNHVEVYLKTVGQYTGLTDIDGSKIFEGDIMRNIGNVVEFCNDGFCINGDSPLAFWTRTKIIGNIHDDLKSMEDK